MHCQHFPIAKDVSAVNAESILFYLFSELLPPDVSFSRLFIDKLHASGRNCCAEPSLVVLPLHWKVLTSQKLYHLRAFIAWLLNSRLLKNYFLFRCREFRLCFSANWFHLQLFLLIQKVVSEIFQTKLDRWCCPLFFHSGFRTV